MSPLSSSQFLLESQLAAHRLCHGCGTGRFFIRLSSIVQNILEVSGFHRLPQDEIGHLGPGHEVLSVPDWNVSGFRSQRIPFEGATNGRILGHLGWLVLAFIAVSSNSW